MIQFFCINPKDEQRGREIYAKSGADIRAWVEFTRKSVRLDGSYSAEDLKLIIEIVESFQLPADTMFSD